MTIEEYVTVLFSSTVLSGGLVFLLRSWISARLKSSIKHEYDQKLETHKAQLKSQTDTEVARLQAQLQIAASQRNIQYPRVFEKVADVIAKTYEKLVAFKRAGEECTFPGVIVTNPEGLAKHEAFITMAREFLTYFDANRIYFARETAQTIDELARALMDAQQQHGAASIVAQRTDVPTLQAHNALFAGYDKTREETERLLGQLEDEFQKHLGLRTEKH